MFIIMLLKNDSKIFPHIKFIFSVYSLNSNMYILLSLVEHCADVVICLGCDIVNQEYQCAVVSGTRGE